MSFPHHLLPLWARGGRSKEEDQLSFCRPRNASFGGHPWALQADSRSSGLSKSRIPALDSISVVWGPLFPHLSKKLNENWGEGWEPLQVKVLYDPHKPGRPTECLCLRTQEAEPSTPILLYCKPQGVPSCSDVPAWAPTSRHASPLCASCLPSKASQQPRQKGFNLFCCTDEETDPVRGGYWPKLHLKCGQGWDLRLGISGALGAPRVVLLGPAEHFDPVG